MSNRLHKRKALLSKTFWRRFWQQCWGWSSLVLMKLLETRFHKSLRFCWTCHWKRHERFHSCLYKWGMTSSAVCECGAEEQTVDHVVHNVQSIDLLMVCTAWRCWTMRQLNGCSIPAPRSSAAKQWFMKNRLKRRRDMERQSELRREVFLCRASIGSLEFAAG